MTDRTPTLHVIAGPNGAGKTTLYRNRIAPRVDAEFVNADELALKHYGHPAQTAQESLKGQQLADSRRAQLMAERKSLVTESTFSHPSKIDLIKQAKQSGYEVVLYHVHVRSPNLSVARVDHRVSQGGHPVPEDKIRERYDRNQPLIRQAAKMADRAYIFDNSELGKPHRLVTVMERGNVVKAAENVPAWARVLYAEEFKGFSQNRLHRAAASFADARQLATQTISADAQTYIPRPGGQYTGKVVAETDLHVVQQVGRNTAIAHFRDQLNKSVAMGQTVQISYSKDKAVKIASVTSQQDLAKNKAKADAFRSIEPKEAVKQYPDLAPSFAYVKAVQSRLQASNPKAATVVAAKVKEQLAGRIERGEPLPPVQVKAAQKPKDQDRSR